MAPPERPPRQGLLSGVLVTLLAEGIAVPAGLITAMVLTRGLGPEVYGRFTVVATTVGITEWLLIAVLARAVVKFVAEAEDWRPVAATSFRVYSLSGIAIAVVFWALAGPVAAALRDPLLADYFRLFAPQIPMFAVGAACRNVLAGQARYREQAAASAVGWIGRVVFIVLFVQLGFGIQGAIYGSISGTLSGSAVALLLTGRSVFGAAGFPVRRLLHLALPAFIAMLCSRLLDQVALLAVQILGAGEAEVGYYGAGMNVMMVTSVIAAAVTPVLLSTLTAARHRDAEDRVRDVSRGAIRFGLGLFPFAFLVAGASGELVELLFGSEYAPAAPILALLMVTAVTRANIAIFDAALIALDRAWTAAAITAPLPLLAVALHSVVVPEHGGIGAALVTLGLALAGATASVLITSRAVGTPLPVGTVIRTVTLAAVAYGVAWVWPTPGLWVVAKMALLIPAVLGGFLLTGELSREELAFLGEMFLAGRTAAPTSESGLSEGE